MQFLRSARYFIRTPGIPDQKHFTGLWTGRWPNLAELVHCPFSIVMKSPVLTPGRSTSDPQKCCGSAWGRAVSHTGTAADKTPPVPLRSYMGAHVHIRNSHILGAPAKGRKPFPVTQGISNTIEWSKFYWCWGGFGQWSCSKLFNTHKFNST